MSKHNEILRKHLETPAMKNATYVSPQTQNELLEIMGKQVILKDIVNEINRAKFYSIMADEVTSHNVEHLAICARFVDAESNIREVFLTFVKLERTTGAFVADQVMQFLNSVGLPLEHIRGQSYDGASNMSSERVGLQARIKLKSPLAVYIHCSSHQLNLVISHSCALPEVRNVLDRLRHCCQFFLVSPKRNGLLELIVSHKIMEDSNRKCILDLCKTRWAERHSTFQHFYQAFVFIVEGLEMIGYRLHIEEYGDLFGDWDSHNRSEAQQLLASITSFDFIVVFMTMYSICHIFQGSL